MNIELENKHPIIEVKKLTRIYNIIDGNQLKNRQILYQALDFNVAQGEFVAVIGPSGCGKTTLLNIIGGLDSLMDKNKIRAIDPKNDKEMLIPESEGQGQILIDKEDIATLKGDKRADFINRNIGFIFQFHHLIPELNARQNVALPMKILGKSSREAHKRAEELLDEMGLSGAYEKKPAVLSGGEKQRVAIARSLANNPKILLADEPTGSLNPKLKNGIIELFCKLNKEKGITILLVTHDKNSLYDNQNNLKIDRFFKLPLETPAEKQGSTSQKLYCDIQFDCPRCIGGHKLNLVHSNGFGAYVCKNCNGVWLDQCDALQNKEYFEDLRKIFQSGLAAN